VLVSLVMTYEEFNSVLNHSIMLQIQYRKSVGFLCWR